MLVTWCGSPVVIPGPGGSGGRCMKPGGNLYYRPPELIHLSMKGKPRPSYRYSDQIVSYEPLVRTMDLYRSNLMLNAPQAQKDLVVAMKCSAVRRHSHDQSDFNAELFNLNNLNKAKSCHNTPRKHPFTMKDDPKNYKMWKDLPKERRESREELSRGRSILRRSSWYRRKSRPQCNQHRYSLPSLRDSSRQKPTNNYSSATDLNKLDLVKVRRSSTSVGDQTRRIPYPGHDMLIGYITPKDFNANVPAKHDTLQLSKSSRSKRVSINLNEVTPPITNHESDGSLTHLKNKKNLDNRRSYSSSVSSSSSSGSCSARHSSLQTRAMARIREFQR